MGWEKPGSGPGSPPPKGTGDGVYKPVPSVPGRHPILIWENPGHLISQRTSAGNFYFTEDSLKQFTHPGYLEAFKE